VFAGLYALVLSVLDALQIVKPDTVIRWHRAGFRAYWRWKSDPRRSAGNRSRNSFQTLRLDLRRRAPKIGHVGSGLRLRPHVASTVASLSQRVH
jgi:hypothetical protein